MNRLLLLCLVALAGCNGPPCGQAQSVAAAQAYASCIRLEQAGSGGVRCGSLAFNTYCKQELP